MKRWWLYLAAAACSLTALAIALWIVGSIIQPPTPLQPERSTAFVERRAERTVSPPRQIAMDEDAVGFSPEVSAEIAASDVKRIEIPAVDIAAAASGPTWPRHSERCKTPEPCIDPPVDEEVAWSDSYAVPSFPSDDSVLLYGHSNRIDPKRQSFNNLPAVIEGDEIIITTETGQFTYQVTKTEDIAFTDVPWREDLYIRKPGRLVLFTCSLGDDFYHARVVEAELVTAEPTP